MYKKIIIHVPHDGDRFPEELMASRCVSEKKFMKYHHLMRDNVSGYIPKARPEIKTVRFDVSRLLCDVERFIDNEPMEEYGMGFCYERAYDGKKIKNIDDALKEKTLKYYLAHHMLLDDEVTDFDGQVVFFDLHGFSDYMVPKGMIDKNEMLPDICIGTGDFFSKKETDLVVREFQKARFSVAVNYPYSGSLVPNAVLKGKAKADVHSFMIEINSAADSPKKHGVYGAWAASNRIKSVINELTEML